MKITIISANNISDEFLSSIAELNDKINICVYDFNVNKAIKLNNVVFEDDLNKSLSEADIVINMLAKKELSEEFISGLTDKYKVKMQNASVALSLIDGFALKVQIDTLAKALLNVNNKKVNVINACEPIDLVTSYLFKAFGIESYGISLKSKNLLSTLFESIDLKEYKDKAKGIMCGVENNLWLAELIDDKGNDIYLKAREKVKDIPLTLSRNDLTRNGLASLKFYGYYHSANVSKQNEQDVVKDLINALLSEEEKTLYLNIINNNLINGLDSEMCVEAPFQVSKKGFNAVTVALPIQCILALNDYASCIIVAAKALATESKDIFKRTIKLDPYLSSKLTLEELEDLSNNLISSIKQLDVLK